MRLTSLLLHVLLCVCLIANGTGAAHAAARMQLQHLQQVPSAAPAAEMHVAAVETSPCHGHGEATHASTPADHSGAAADHSNAAADHKKAGSHRDTCCKGGACFCDCAPQVACALPVAVVPPAPGHSALRQVAVAVAHSQPRLPHLIRPPIG